MEVTYYGNQRIQNIQRIRDSALLQAILSRYSHVRQIELATDLTPKTIAFYKSMGFYELSEIGCCGFMKESCDR